MLPTELLLKIFEFLQATPAELFINFQLASRSFHNFIQTNSQLFETQCRNNWGVKASKAELLEGKIDFKQYYIERWQHCFPQNKFKIMLQAKTYDAQFSQEVQRLARVAEFHGGERIRSAEAFPDLSETVYVVDYETCEYAEQYSMIKVMVYGPHFGDQKVMEIRYYTYTPQAQYKNATYGKLTVDGEALITTDLGQEVKGEMNLAKLLLFFMQMYPQYMKMPHGKALTSSDAKVQEDSTESLEPKRKKQKTTQTNESVVSPNVMDSGISSTNALGVLKLNNSLLESFFTMLRMNEFYDRHVVMWKERYHSNFLKTGKCKYYPFH